MTSCEVYAAASPAEEVGRLFPAYAGWRERADRPAWCTQTGQMVHGGRSRGAHDRHAGLLYSVIPLRLRMESPSTRIE